MIEGTCAELDGLPHELVLGNYVCATIDESMRELHSPNEREDDGKDDFTINQKSYAAVVSSLIS